MAVAIKWTTPSALTKKVLLTVIDCYDVEMIPLGDVIFSSGWGWRVLSELPFHTLINNMTDTLSWHILQLLLIATSAVFFHSIIMFPQSITAASLFLAPYLSLFPIVLSVFSLKKTFMFFFNLRQRVDRKRSAVHCVCPLIPPFAFSRLVLITCRWHLLRAGTKAIQIFVGGIWNWEKERCRWEDSKTGKVMTTAAAAWRWLEHHCCLFY